MMGFDADRWSMIVSKTGLWYADDEIWPTIERLFVGPSKETDHADRSLKNDILRFFAKCLMDGTVKLGRRAQFFNDHDRCMDTFVIHHTATNPRLSYDMLNALGLLRSYCPLYKNNPAFRKNGQLQSISSGHLYAGRPTFAEYHYAVYDVGMFEGSYLRMLDDRYIGLHVGDHRINCRSIGIAIVGDLTQSIPTQKTIDRVNKIIAEYSRVTKIIGHKEVDSAETTCPGNTWDQWKHMLVLPG